MTYQLRVVVADEQADVRYALRTLLQLARELEAQVVGEAVDAASLLAQLEAQQPDMLLLDWQLPGLRLAGLRALYPSLPIIVLSVRSEARQAALTAGALAFVYKGDPVERLIEAIHTARPTPSYPPRSETF